MRTPPPEVLAAAHLITKWAAENNIREFAIDGIQQRIPASEPVAVRWRWPGYRWTYEDHKPGQFYAGRVEVQRLTVVPVAAPVNDDWCTDYHCAGDCGLRGHGYQHQGHGVEDDPEQQEWVISGLSDHDETPRP